MAYRSSSQSSIVNDVTVDVAVPASLANGDLVNIFVFHESSVPVITPPSGFTEDSTYSNTGSSFRQVRIRRLYKYITNAAGEGSGGNYTIGASYAEPMWAIAVAHSGRANSAATVSATDDGAAAASPISVPLTGVTAATGDDVITVYGLAPADSSVSTSSNTAPSSYTARQNINNLWRVDQLATRDNVTAGATGTLTAASTFDGAATSQYTGLVVALPATGGGGASAKLLSMINNQAGF